MFEIFNQNLEMTSKYMDAINELNKEYIKKYYEILQSNSNPYSLWFKK